MKLSISRSSKLIFIYLSWTELELTLNGALLCIIFEIVVHLIENRLLCPMRVNQNISIS